MIDLLLTHGFFLADDPVEQRVMRPYVPLGLLSIAAFLRREGYSVDVFDSTFSSIAGFERKLRECAPAAVGIYVTLMTRKAAIRLARIARSAGCFVIAGGPEPAGYAEQFLAHGCDAVVLGEGEETLAEILAILRSGKQDLQEVRGIVVRAPDGSVVHTRPRSLIRSLDSLPLPARDLVDLRPYLEAWKSRHGVSSLSMVTMRGCPYTCAWCSHGVYGETYRRRSPGLCADEVRTLVEQYAPDTFWFADDVFTISHRWLFGFREALEARGLSVRYECITRADRVTENVADALRDTGCFRVWIGGESGSQRILDAMSRGVTVEQIAHTTSTLRRAGMEVGLFVMFGYPGESESDIEQTLLFVRSVVPDFVLSTVAYPIRGTRMYRELGGSQILPQVPFDEWNDRMISVPGRRTRSYYWFAHRRLIHEVSVSRTRSRNIRRLPRFAVSVMKARLARFGMRLARHL